ncbi:MAG: hypothetical protein KAT56_01490, partial [Sedimentisphaerales bacterium]|nr:hypothetical protein [Sedimentisphaerales bacterium]
MNKIARMFIESGKNSGFFRGGQPCRRGSHSSMATILLAAILTATLLGAQVLVSARSGQFLAYLNAVELIEKVHEEGLTKYLNKPIQRYYLIESDGEPVAYAAISVRPIQQGEHSMAISGNELYYNPQAKIRKDISYQVQNDLSSYIFREVTQDRANGSYETVQKKFTPGILQLSYYNSARPKTPAKWIKINKKNFIPSFLLDLFSSVAAVREGAAEGSLFAMMDDAFFRDYRRNIFIECWVKPSGEVLQTNHNDHPGGSGV